MFSLVQVVLFQETVESKASGLRSVFISRVQYRRLRLSPLFSPDFRKHWELISRLTIRSKVKVNFSVSPLHEQVMTSYIK